MFLAFYDITVSLDSSRGPLPTATLLKTHDVYRIFAAATGSTSGSAMSLIHADTL